jgi:hypothetical protein
MCTGVAMVWWQMAWTNAALMGSIEADEEAGTAVSRAYFTVLQALPDLALQPIVSGRYRDRFERFDGQWPFTERRVLVDLVGDVSHHLRHPK